VNGTLIQNPVPRAVYDQFLHQSSGYLLIDLPSGEVRLWFLNGQLVGFQSVQRNARVYDIAVELGFISQQKISILHSQEAALTQNPCRFLVESGLIVSENLNTLRREVMLREFGGCCLSASEPKFFKSDLPESIEPVILNLFGAFFHVFAYYSTPQQISDMEKHYQDLIFQPHMNLRHMMPAMELPARVKASLEQWSQPRCLRDLYVVSGLNQREMLALIGMLELCGALSIGPRPVKHPSGESYLENSDNAEKSAIALQGKEKVIAPRPQPVETQPAQPAENAKRGLSQVQRQTVDAMIAWQEKIKNQNPFDILDIGPDAAPEAIKQAYSKLTRMFHPDRLMGSVREDLTSMAESVFAQIGNAYQLLSDKAMRDEIVNSLSDPAICGNVKKLDMRKRAALDIEKTKVLFRKGDYRSTILSARRALGLFPYDPTMMAMLAFSLYHSSPDKQTAQAEANTYLERAIKIDPKSEIAQFYKGLIARMAGDKQTAIHQFKLVLALNPKHTDARQQLAGLTTPNGQ
jgi:tetratricopeptide (TPR) repeat protein